MVHALQKANYSSRYTDFINHGTRLEVSVNLFMSEEGELIDIVERKLTAKWPNRCFFPSRLTLICNICVLV